MQKFHTNIYLKHLCAVTLIVIAQLVSAQEPTLVTTDQGVMSDKLDFLESLYKKRISQ